MERGPGGEVPARSDLVALAFAATICGLLLAALRTSVLPWLGIVIFGSLPFVPLAAAVTSGPPHSFRSRFQSRGGAAVVGMAIAFALFGDSCDIGPLGLILGVLWAVAFSALAVLIVVVGHILLARADQ